MVLEIFTLCRKKTQFRWACACWVNTEMIYLWMSQNGMTFTLYTLSQCLTNFHVAQPGWKFAVFSLDPSAHWVNAENVLAYSRLSQHRTNFNLYWTFLRYSLLKSNSLGCRYAGFIITELLLNRLSSELLLHPASHSVTQSQPYL